jgi:hypothetical protein
MALSKVDPNFLNVSQVGGRRNLIINGAMQVAQRGTSETGVTGNSYGADRFVLGGSSNLAVYTVENVVDAPANTGLKNSIKYTCTTGDTPASTYYKETKHVIESGGCDVMEYGTSTAKTTTLSFWVKSNVTGTYSLYAYNNVASPTVMYSLNYTINSAGTWERKVVTIPPDTANPFSTSPNGSGIRLYWPILAGPGYSSGTSSQARGVGWETVTNANLMGGQTANIVSVNDYWQMTGVQLEVGDIDTPFEHRSYGEESSLCERYYQKSYDWNYYAGDITYDGAISQRSPGNVSSNQLDSALPTRMRAMPTVTFYGTSAATNTAGNIRGSGDAVISASTGPSVSETRINISFTSNQTYSYISAHYIADAEL